MCLLKLDLSIVFYNKLIFKELAVLIRHSNDAKLFAIM